MENYVGFNLNIFCKLAIIYIWRGVFINCKWFVVLKDELKT